MNKRYLLLLLLVISVPLFADKVYIKNKNANKLYAQGKFAEAISLYEEALAESPKDKKLMMNKGSAFYKIGQLDKAEEAYKKSESVDDRSARADLLYNMGNLFNMQADQMAASGNQQAMDKLKAARDSYIKALDMRPSDENAKWNLEITQQKIKMLDQQQKQQNQQNQNQDKDNKQNQQNKQNQDQNKDNKQNQNKDNKQDQQNKQDQDQNQNKENKQDQNQQNKEKEKQEQNNQQNQNDKEKQKQQQQQPQPQPKDSTGQVKKEEAMRLLLQYSDDAEELNKPKKKVKVLQGTKSDKDW